MLVRRRGGGERGKRGWGDGEECGVVDMYLASSFSSVFFFFVLKVD